MILVVLNAGLIFMEPESFFSYGACDQTCGFTHTMQVLYHKAMPQPSESLITPSQRLCIYNS
jgi:hypothetical protein